MGARAAEDFGPFSEFWFLSGVGGGAVEEEGSPVGLTPLHASSAPGSPGSAKEVVPLSALSFR